LNDFTQSWANKQLVEVLSRGSSRLLLASLVLALAVTDSSGQEKVSTETDPLQEPLITDRPDFTESTEAVPTGHFQLEMGYTFTYDREDSDRVQENTTPELLARIGLADNFELRIGWEGYSFTRLRFDTPTRSRRTIGRKEWAQGSNDITLGFKLKLAEQDGWRPHTGIIGEISIPSGSPNRSSGDVDPTIKFLWAYDLSDRLSLAGNLNVGVPTENAHRFVQAAASLVLGVALTDSVGTYVEYFGFYPGSDGTDAAHSLNGGFTFLVNSNLQFDVRVGVGLNEEADDFFTGVGLAWRF
jgi:hypothetical protein